VSQAGSGDSDGTAGAAPIGGSAGAENRGHGGRSGSAGSAGQSSQPGEYKGTIQVGWLDNGDQFYTTAQAVFAVPMQPSGRSCTTQVVDACTVYTCVTSTQPAMVPQAGTITLSNGDMFNVTLMPNGDGGYSTHSEQHVLLPGEDNITISATGGDVPAFSSVLVQPLTLLVNSPAADTTGVVAWSRDMDLSLKFDRGAANVQLLVQGGASPGVTVECLFPSQPGEATIPSAALKQLPPGTTLYVFTYKVQSITAGQYAIDLKAFSAAMDPDKKRGIRVSVP